MTRPTILPADELTAFDALLVVRLERALKAAKCVRDEGLPIDRHALALTFRDLDATRNAVLSLEGRKS